MRQSVFIEAIGGLEGAITALQALRAEYVSKRLTPEQRARAKSILGTIGREMMLTAGCLDGQ